MKNYLHLLAVVGLVVGIGLGCRFIGGDEPASPSNTSNTSNKTLTDKAVDTTVGRSSTGIPECDQVMNDIEAELNNPDDNFVVKAAKATILNRFKDGIRESFEKNPNDTAELVKTCKEFKGQFDRYKAEEQSKGNQ